MRKSIFAAIALFVSVAAAAAAPVEMIDLAEVPALPPTLTRIHGFEGDGAFGVSVAGGHDCDGDGHPDLAFAAMLASPEGRDRAGTVYLFFGDGTIGGAFDAALASPRLLRFQGAAPLEVAGNEIWIDDVTGDGIGDLLIGRQNYAPTRERPGVGALSIVVGSAALREHAVTLAAVELDDPPEGVTITTLVGNQEFGRFGIWMRTGDIDGDGIADIVVGADQEQHGNESHGGAAYVIRGGAHLAGGGALDFGGDVNATALAGHWLRLEPPADAFEYHFGATVQIGDLDGNGRGEVLVAAALNRAGATLRARDSVQGSAHGIGGTARGTAYIFWDDNFPSDRWEDPQPLRTDAAPGSITTLHGGERNLKFGEELVAGADFDGDGSLDLFVGDIVGDLSAQRDRPQAGSGHVFYNAARLKGRTIDLRSPPNDIETTDFLGAARQDIAADTALHGDFDGDGRPDLAFSAPHASFAGRVSVGAVYVFFGGGGRWPRTVDLREPLAATGARATAIYGALGTDGRDSGDTLAYSAAVGDLDGDGRDDLIVNEMEGNGLQPGTIDVGNLIALSGTRIAGLAADATCPPVPAASCERSGTSRSVLRHRPEQGRLDWRWNRPLPNEAASFGDPATGARISLCLYGGDGLGSLRHEIRLPRVPPCGTPPCWRRSERSWRFREMAGVEQATSALLRSDSEQALLAFRARDVGAPELGSPVTVQFRAATGACWEMSYPSELRRRAGLTIWRR